MINTVAIMGRLTYDPELKSTNTGKSVIRFQVAVDRPYQASGKERQADFIDCVAWEKAAEFVHRYFHKGSMIAVEGSIQTTNYTDNSGKNRKSTEVNARQISFCGSKEQNETKPVLNIPVDENNIEVIEDDEKLPWED